MKTILLRLIPYDKLSFWYAIVIVISAGIITALQKKTGIQAWRIICVIPILISLGHFLLFHFRGYEKLTLLLYGMIYLTTMIIAMWPYISENAYPAMSWVVNVLAVISLICCVVIPAFLRPHIGNYTKKDYTACFEGILEQMSKDYILNEWKEIDYDFLEEKIMPIVKQAEEKDDEALFCMALLTYQYYFYDGHVMLEAISSKGEEGLLEAKRRLAGNDYGFSMIRLDDGATIAILVDENSDAYKNGIRFGTKIIGFNGKNIDEAIEETMCIYPEHHSFPVKSNEDYVKPIFLAGKAGDKVDVRFVDVNGTEQEIILEKTGDYVERLDKALDLFYHRNTDDYDNFECHKIADNCGYLRIKSEFVNNSGNLEAQIKGEYTILVNEIDKKLKDLNGIERLIIDMRNNCGGYDLVSLAVTSLFTDEEWYAYSDGKVSEGRFVAVDDHYMKGTGKWKDIKVDVLVNSECRSAGDSMTYYLSKLPNVTIYGITRNNGIDQNPGGYCITTDGSYGIKYPIGPVIDENGLPMIDTKADRLPRVDLDYHIELDTDAAYKIFELEEDYELEFLLSSAPKASTLPN